MGDSKRKVSICCGGKKLAPGWEYIDIVDHGFNQVVEDIRRLPFEDESIDVIYSSHTLEYFNREEGFEVLNEFKRVLKKEGTLWLSVPDFRKMAEMYVDDDIPLHRLVGPLYGQMQVGEKTVYHKTVYDYSSLGELLRMVGFRRLDRWQPYSFEEEVNGDESYDDCSRARIEGGYLSLNIKCIKV